MSTATMEDFDFGSGFGFTGATIDDLGATEYTLATIAFDESGSIGGFEKQIKDMLDTVVDACKKSPRASNLLLRIIRFSSRYTNGVNEFHGFKPLGDINAADYTNIRGGGSTPLNDAVYSGVGATNAYGKSLTDMDFLVNGITFIITDGEENSSTASAKMVKQELKKSVTGEILESHLSILIGIDTGYSGSKGILQQYQTDTGIDQFIWAGDATPGKLAKLAQFVSQSISSTSQALGTGGPSQQISATI
jgi:hypothetical protein